MFTDFLQLFFYESAMHKAITNAIKVAQKDEEVREYRSARQTMLTGMDKMMTEEDQKAETWNDPMGVQLLFNCIDYVPHTDCWECEKTCECGFVGSMWATKMVRIFRNNRIECEQFSTLKDDSLSENNLDDCFTNV